MKITAFDDLFPRDIATGGTWMGTASGSNSGASGGDITGEPGDLSVVGLRSIVSIASNAGDSTIGTVLTTIQTAPWVAAFAVASNSAASSNSLLRTQGGAGGVTTIAASGGATSLMIGGANTFDVTLTANCVISLSGPAASGSESSVLLILRQDGTGGRTVTWPGSVVWANGPPTLSTGASEVDFIVLETVNGGATWFGFPVGGGEPTADAHIADTADAHDAGAVSILDTAGYYTGSDVEAALAELGAGGVGGNGAQHILLADGHATPFAFTDLLQMDDGSDFMWSD